MWVTSVGMTQMKTFTRIKDIVREIRGGSLYMHDRIGNREGDHLTHPSRIQKQINNKQKLGDCDDHAIYWCTALLKSKLAQKVWFCIYAMEKDDGKLSAHAVCVFVDNKNDIYWCDYGQPEKIEEVKDFMKASAKKYKATPFVGYIWHVDKIKPDDTPVFGEITRYLP